MKELKAKILFNAVTGQFYIEIIEDREIVKERCENGAAFIQLKKEYEKLGYNLVLK